MFFKDAKDTRGRGGEKSLLLISRKAHFQFLKSTVKQLKVENRERQRMCMCECVGREGGREKEIVSQW